MTQTLMIDVFGRPLTAYRDDNLIDLSVMGRQSIARFSEVLFDEERQWFYVLYRDTAPESARDTRMTIGQYLAATERQPASAGVLARLRGWQGNASADTAFFQTYGDAVWAEQRVLERMMEEGRM